MSQVVACWCIPSIFGFKDYRGSVKTDRYEYGYLENAKGRRFGVAIPHPNTELRFVLGNLFIWNPILAAIRMPLRAVCLLTADFARVGYQLARREWEMERQAWSLDENRQGLPPGTASLAGKIIAKSLLQLAINIMKIITYPFAMLAMAFATLYGCFIHPVDGMQMCSSIELAWSRQETSISRPACHPLYRLTDIAAICMQSEDAWEDRNLYINASPSRTQLMQIKKTLKQCGSFFNNEDVDVAKMQSWVATWQGTHQRRGHTGDFKKIIDSLNNIRALRLEIVEEQVKIQRGGSNENFMKCEESLEKILMDMHNLVDTVLPI